MASILFPGSMSEYPEWSCNTSRRVLDAQEGSGYFVTRASSASEELLLLGLKRRLGVHKFLAAGKQNIETSGATMGIWIGDRRFRLPRSPNPNPSPISRHPIAAPTRLSAHPNRDPLRTGRRSGSSCRHYWAEILPLFLMRGGTSQQRASAVLPCAPTCPGSRQTRHGRYSEGYPCHYQWVGSIRFHPSSRNASTF